MSIEKKSKQKNLKLMCRIHAPYEVTDRKENKLNLVTNLEAYLEPCQTFKMKCFAKIVDFAKHSILCLWEGYEYFSVNHTIFMNISKFVKEI